MVNSSEHSFIKKIHVHLEISSRKVQSTTWIPNNKMKGVNRQFDRKFRQLSAEINKTSITLLKLHNVNQLSHPLNFSVNCLRL